MLLFDSRYFVLIETLILKTKTQMIELHEE